MKKLENSISKRRQDEIDLSGVTKDINDQFHHENSSLFGRTDFQQLSATYPTSISIIEQ